MFLQNKRNLQQVLVSLLAKKHPATAVQLLDRVSAMYRVCSIQAVYKELRKLQTAGVVVKAKDKYSLSLSWILNGMDFLDSAYDSYMEQSSLGSILPVTGKRQVWYFTDLRKTDDFWVQCMLALIQKSDTKKMLQWVPLPWFELIHHEKDIAFQNALRASGGVLRFVIGGNSFLYRHCVRNWPDDVYKCSMAESPFQHQRRSSFLVSENYILTITLDKETTEIIDNLFDRVSSVENLDPSQVMGLFDRKTKVTVKLENNPAAALTLKRKFCRFLGLNAAKF